MLALVLRFTPLSSRATLAAMLGIGFHKTASILSRSHRMANRRLSLTWQCEVDIVTQLASATWDGLRQIEASLEDIRLRDVADPRQLTLACTLGGLPTGSCLGYEFQARYPHITLNVQVPLAICLP